MWLFLLFFTVPVIEIVLFIKVGGTIGLMPTVFIILITAIAGTVFVKQQASQLSSICSNEKREDWRTLPNLLGMVY